MTSIQYISAKFPVKGITSLGRDSHKKSYINYINKQLAKEQGEKKQWLRGNYTKFFGFWLKKFLAYRDLYK